MNKEQFKINIRIEGRAYPLTIQRNDEERYRIAAKTVNDTIVRFREQFRDNDVQDILAMTAYQMALNYNELLKHEDKSLFIDKLKDLNDDISDFLKRK